MRENTGKIYLALGLSAISMLIAAGAIMALSAPSALSLFLGAIVMTANLFVLIRTLASVFLKESPSALWPALAIVVKMAGLLGATYLIAAKTNVNTLVFGISASATVLLFSLYLALLEKRGAAA